VLTAIIAQPVGRAQAQDISLDAYVKTLIKKARAACARELDISRLPDNDIDLVARYGMDKANAFKDCVRHALQVDEQHLPPGR